MSTDAERVPLLQRHRPNPQQYNQTPQLNSNRRTRAQRSDSLASTTSIVSTLSAISTYVLQSPIFNLSKTVKRFIAIVMWALLATVVFQLVFLPRTSLSRDYRRLHFGIVARAEIERLYLRSFIDDDHEASFRELMEESQKRSYVFGEKEGNGDEMKEFMIKKFREFGHDVKVKRYWSSVPQFINNSLELEDANGVVLKKFDLSDGKHDVGLNSYHSYSHSGDVTSEYIYADYGKQENYESLLKTGVELKNKIHIIRDSSGVEHSFQLAEHFGASGIILFNHPNDDYSVNELPKRDPDSIEGKSVKFSNSWPGDPTTLDHACTRYYWCPREYNTTGKTPSIPSLSISYSSAKELVPHLSGSSEPSMEKKIPSSSRLHLINDNILTTQPIDNIFFEIPGLLDEIVIVGAPRDSLTSVHEGGATDASGNALLLSLSKHLGKLVKKGWRPLRTVRIVSWDGSKVGFLGSSEYGKDQKHFLSEEVVSYINLKGISGTRFEAKGNPLLSKYIKQVAKIVPVTDDIDNEDTLFDFWSRQENGVEYELLGGQGDHMWFQYALGIPSCSIGFVHWKHDPLHYENSRFDSLKRLESIDPDFTLHDNLVKYLGLLTIWFSENETLDFKTSHYYDVINTHFERLSKNLDSKVTQSIRTKLQLLKQRTSQFDTKNRELQDQISIDYPWFKSYIKIKLAFRIKIMTNIAKRLDSNFLDTSGLRGRPLLKHTVWSPDNLDASRSDVLPGLHEAIRSGDEEEISHWLEALDTKLSLVNKHLAV